ncbi:hypothetical protein M3J09_009130 [Ascochyta lentis]
MLRHLFIITTSSHYAQTLRAS